MKDTQTKPLRFIFITMCVGEKFFEPVKKGMHDAAAMLGVSCEFVGTTEVDVDAQVQLVRDAIRDGYDGIALLPVQQGAFGGVVKEALERGVPVVAFNIDDPDCGRLSVIAQNLFEAGRTLASNAAEFIAPGSRVLVTLHNAGIASLEARLAGIQQVLTEKDIRWRTLVTGITCEASASVIAATLREHPDIRVVLGTGQADTEGAGRAVEQHFDGREYSVAGFDLSAETLRLIKLGVIRFTIDQQPYVQGFYPVVQLALHCRYGLVPSSFDAGAVIIDAANVDEVMALVKNDYR